MGYIYSITNNLNRKIYVGQTSSKYISTRWGNHKSEARNGTNKPLYNAMNKYGLENFTFKILLKDVPNDMLCHYEIIWIKKLNSIVPNGYNISNGGKTLVGKDNPMYGKKPWNKGRALSQKEKDNLKNKFTEERRERYRENIVSGRNPMIKIAQAKNIGRKHKSDSISKNVLNQKNRMPVVMIDKNTNTEIMCFMSIGQASKYIRENTKFVKADYATINKICKGIGKSAYGYCWSYITI